MFNVFNILERIVPSYVGRRFVNRIVDRYYGLDTEGAVNLRDLGLADCERIHYAPSGWFTMQRIARIIPFQPTDVFVDFGSGKGRVIVMAARYYHFKRVIGVDIAQQLNEVARANIERNRRRLLCQQVELVTCDAIYYALPEDMNIAYFYSPFYGSIFKEVVQNIRNSWEKRANRRLWVVLQHPIQSSRLAYYQANNSLLASSPWLRHKNTVKTNSHFISVYKAEPS